MNYPAEFRYIFRNMDIMLKPEAVINFSEEVLEELQRKGGHIAAPRRGLPHLTRFGQWLPHLTGFGQGVGGSKTTDLRVQGEDKRRGGRPTGIPDAW